MFSIFFFFNALCHCFSESVLLRNEEFQFMSNNCKRKTHLLCKKYRNLESDRKNQVISFSSTILNITFTSKDLLKVFVFVGKYIFLMCFEWIQLSFLWEINFLKVSFRGYSIYNESLKQNFCKHFLPPDLFSIKAYKQGWNSKILTTGSLSNRFQ